jgi:hypothetical protein
MTNFDVFISYSNKDKMIADTVCASLEASNIRCWMAPRNVLPGEAYAEALINGLNQSRIMVLIFSGNSNDSPQVTREVERAVNKDMPILPFRIENVVPSKSMEYFVSSSHWLDALTPPFERHLQTLAETVKLLLAGKTQEIQQRQISSYPAISARKVKTKKKGGVTGLIIILLLLLGLGAAAYYYTDGFRKFNININIIPTITSQKPPAASSTTPLPSTTPPSAPVSTAGKLLFEDDFSKVSPGWKRVPNDFMDTSYEGGEFSVLAKKPSRPVIFNASAGKFKDMLLDIDARMVSGARQNSYGVVFRVQDTSDLYSFLISGQGDYTLQKILGGQVQDVVKKTPSAYIKQGNNTNRLRVVCKGAQLDLYCNGNRLASITDASLGEGFMGVMLNCLESPFNARYNNLKIVSVD